MRLTQAEYDALLRGGDVEVDSVIGTDPRPDNPLKQSEHDIQVAFFILLSEIENKYPEAADMYAIPNGGLRPYTVRWSAKLGKEVRFSRESKKLKDEGAKSGIPDTHLPVSRMGYNSLYIEFKTQSGSLSQEQKYRLRRLTLRGNLCFVMRDAYKARDAVIAYLDSDTTTIEELKRGRRWLE